MSGEEEVPVLAIHATRLLDAGDVLTLAKVLSGSRRPATLGILQALQTTTSVSLLPETIVLASTSKDAEVSRLAMDNLVRLARENEDVTERLILRIEAADLPLAAQRTMVRVLGRSRNLGAVDALITLIGGPLSGAGREGLEELTGHSFGEDAKAWSDFWERSRTVARDVLLERSLAAEKRSRRQLEQHMRQEVVQARIRLMGMDVDLLVAGLSDDYPAVRLASARQLGSHPNGEQAATSIPVMIERLGYGSAASAGLGAESARIVDPGVPTENGQGTSDGESHGSAENGAVPDHQNGADVDKKERDPEVRSALVAALGILGRGQQVVQDVLLAELHSGDAQTAAVAATAFERLRGHPEVVLPLLQFLERSPPEEGTLVTVLRVVGNNQPAGVLQRLAEWLNTDYSPTVRAAAVAAVMASADLASALDAVADVAANEDVRDVRYALAKSLGDRVRDLHVDDAARPAVLELLARLLDDVDSSVRAEAASSVGDAGGPEAFSILDARSRAEVDVSVMMRIVHALGELGDRSGVGVIGRVCGSWTGEGSVELTDSARRALLALGEGVPADGWLAMAGTLQDVGDAKSAAWALREILLRHEGDAGSREVVSMARGHLAEVLCLNGQPDEAYQILVELHEAGAPYPGLRLRLSLLARSSEELGLFDQAANYFLESLEELAVGDATRAETQHGAVRTLMSAGRHGEALPLLQELHAQDAGDNDTMYRLARAQAALGMDRAAVELLQRLLPRIPFDEDATRQEVEVLLAELAPELAPSALEAEQAEEIPSAAEPADADAGTDEPVTPSPATPPATPEDDSLPASGEDEEDDGVGQR